MTVITPPQAPEAPQAPAPPRPVSTPAERSQALTWTIAALAGIWVAVVLISVFAPDNVSGSQQEHIPIAAILTWIWGLIASRNLVTAIVRRRGVHGVANTARLMALVVIPIWVAATIVAVFCPVLVTGTDPTRLPLGAIIAPVAALVFTQAVTQLATSFEETDGS